MQWTWLRVVCLLACLGSLSGCDLGGLSQGIGCGLRDSFAGTFGFSDDGQPLQSDTGGYVATAHCGGDDCTRREVLRGSQLSLELDLTENARAAGVDAPEHPADITLGSSATAALSVDDFRVVVDDCTDHVWATSTVTFRAEGDADLVLRDGRSERARFSFAVHEAASIELVGQTDELSGELRGTVTAPAGSLVRVSSLVRNAEGVRLSTGGEVEFSVDDPEIAALAFSWSEPSASGRGAWQGLILQRPGMTTVRAQVSHLTATLDVVVVGEPSPQDEDAGSRDDAAAWR